MKTVKYTVSDDMIRGSKRIASVTAATVIIQVVTAIGFLILGNLPVAAALAVSVFLQVMTVVKILEWRCHRMNKAFFEEIRRQVRDRLRDETTIEIP